MGDEAGTGCVRAAGPGVALSAYRPVGDRQKELSRRPHRLSDLAQGAGAPSCGNRARHPARHRLPARRDRPRDGDRHEAGHQAGRRRADDGERPMPGVPAIPV
ncbi:hypothetical protein G6F57_022718 [Rhizopus arrhizus]|uniref:Uncharacterized protein n=1 Tax=Rhizopus oryzae TaxID=64495 RepID=A0A9P6WTH9_RHIOR|nr:hypothetical protein G6F40_016644 [Rhizopus arrhizus]KAG1277467.1 hypothetical protein G6F64_014723 [Rhizopus arrhizus]KAG1432768.1 hypothetical protein G6F57_022718 [Rhizopus arrhizus]